MRNEVKLKNLEEKIKIFEVMRKALSENETKRIYLPFTGDSMYWHFVGKKNIVIEELNNKLKSAIFINDKELNKMMHLPIIITIEIENVDNVTNEFVDLLNNTIYELKCECIRLEDKVQKRKAV